MPLGIVQSMGLHMPKSWGNFVSKYTLKECHQPNPSWCPGGPCTTVTLSTPGACRSWGRTSRWWPGHRGASSMTRDRGEFWQLICDHCDWWSLVIGHIIFISGVLWFLVRWFLLKGDIWGLEMTGDMRWLTLFGLVWGLIIMKLIFDKGILMIFLYFWYSVGYVVTGDISWF